MRLRAVLAALIGVTGLAFAQSAPLLINSAEYNIGFDCPQAQTLAPDGTTLYVLMAGCLSRITSVMAFNVADGSPVPLDSAYTEELASLQGGFLFGYNTPMALTPDGLLNFYFSDEETFETRSLFIALDDSAVSALPIADDALTELLLTVTEYPEGAVYSDDHTQVAAVGSSSLSVFDLTTGNTVLTLPVEEETYNAYPSFSPDGQTLYVAVLDDIDDAENYNATVSAYSLPNGALMHSFAAPSFSVWVSPDGRYAAVQLGSNDGESSELFVVDTASGAVSEPFSLHEPPHRLTTCANDGRDMSDIDSTVSGKLSLISVSWLPDSSSFVFTRSYGGEASGGVNPCAYNYSRLNRFEVHAANE